MSEPSEHEVIVRDALSYLVREYNWKPKFAVEHMSRCPVEVIVGYAMAWRKKKAEGEG